MKAIKAVPAAINKLVTFKPAFRPLRSARLPITSAPSGRIAKPMPNVSNAISNEAKELSEGKKSLPMITAEKLYTVKS